MTTPLPGAALPRPDLRSAFVATARPVPTERLRLAAPMYRLRARRSIDDHLSVGRADGRSGEGNR